MEVADIVIGNMSPVGEAAISLEGMPQKVAPSTTVTTAVILNALVAQTCSELLSRGIRLPVPISMNVDIPPDERDRDRAAIAKYRQRVRWKDRHPETPLAELLKGVSRGYTTKET